MKLTKKYSGDSFKAQRNAEKVTAQICENYAIDIEKQDKIVIVFYGSEPTKKRCGIKRTELLMNEQEAQNLIKRLQETLQDINQPNQNK